MPSIEKSSRDHLRKMVRGAARRSVCEKSNNKAARLSLETIAQLQSQMEKFGKTIQKIPIKLIALDENIRERYCKDKLDQLAKSLQSEGLIQFPSLCLRQLDGEAAKLICRNGHRRILAAKQLGWTSIECVIIPFESAREELYHTINANLREDVFYLDLAFAYQEAHNLGESDQIIAERVGLNPRTVGWYRRLTVMSQSCQNLCREHPEVFHATWAIKLARQGQLPDPKRLEADMRAMLVSKEEASSNSPQVSRQQKLHAEQKLRHWLQEEQNHRQFARDLLEGLVAAGYISAKLVKKIDDKLLAEQASAVGFVEKGLRRRREQAQSKRRAKA